MLCRSRRIGCSATEIQGDPTMNTHRRAGLAATVAAGLLASLVVMPVGAQARPLPAAPAPAAATAQKPAACTAARQAVEDYAAGPVADLAAAAETRVTEVEALIGAAEADLVEATEALAAADEAQGTAQEVLDAAVVALEAAEEDGDPDLIAEAQAAYDAAYQAEIDSMGVVFQAEVTFYAAEDALGSLQAELVETQALADFLLEARLGRDFETEQQVVDYLAALEAADLGEYADLVGALADACFAVAGDGDDEDDDAVPAAPAAAPVTARASYPG